MYDVAKSRVIALRGNIALGVVRTQRLESARSVELIKITSENNEEL
jgi:hypothetical protein